jgi:molybdate transport system substrate-binding protein
MKNPLWFAAAVLILCCSTIACAEDVTLIAPGGMRCPVDRITPDFERKTGHKVKATIGSGGGTHQQVVKGDAFDVPIVQPPYQDVIASGNVVPGSETPLATVAVVVAVKKGSRKPDISTPDAVKKMLLAAKAISYPNGAAGAAAGVSFDATMKKLGVFDEMQPKIKRVQGVTLMQLLTKGDIDVAITFSSEIDDPGVEVVGALPASISTPTGLVGFVSSHTKAPEAAKALLSYLASSDAAAAYKACMMKPGR